MSTRRVQSSAIKPRTLGSEAVPWVRNPSWLALTAVSDSEQRFRGLVAVFPQSSYLALSAAGNYTVDWGDGSSENVNTGVTALKLYDFNDADLANTNAPVTLTDAGDLVERTAHGYSNGMEVRFYNIVSTTGLTAAQTYYVINATTNNFQVTETVGGSAIALTTNGSATLLPYKQAIVVVTPQAGQNLTTFNLNVKHTATNLQTYETGWLDIELSGTNLSASGLTIGGTNVRFAMCERAAIRSIGSCTNLSNLFNGFRKLRQIILGNTAAVTNVFSMFNSCVSLTAAPFFDTAAVNNASQMFVGCSSLTTVPLYNTAVVTNANSMFNGCTSLTTVPLLNLISVNNANEMFVGCRSLISVPLFNFKTTGTISMAGTFAECSSLTTVPLFNTVAVNNTATMFRNCSSLVSVPLFNLAAVTDANQMFISCEALANVPLFNIGAVTNANNFLRNCRSLVTVPLFNTAAVTNAGSMFQGCSSLSSVPALNVSAVSSSGNFGSMFTDCGSLSRIQASNFNYTFSVANCKLGATELNEIYTNLPTVATTQTITVTGNHGTAGDTPSIAENKGWTVAG